MTKTNDSDLVIAFLQWIFGLFGLPGGMYVDPGPYFGKRIKDLVQPQGLVFNNSPVAAKRAVGMEWLRKL